MNPLARVDAPTYKAGERRSLTLEQVGALLAAAKGDPLEALYVLAVTTGMRQGELFALRWDAIELDAGSLSVTGNLQTVGSELVIQQPKTPRSRRRVELTKLAVQSLRRRRAIVKKDGHESPYVFAARTADCRGRATSCADHSDRCSSARGSRPRRRSTRSATPRQAYCCSRGRTRRSSPNCSVTPTSG